MTIEEGLGSMSAMLVIISIITIGAIMAVRNKTRGKIVKDAKASLENLSHQASLL